MNQPPRKPYVFISHASGDVKSARELVARLHQHGVETWMAPDDVQPGREFSIQLEEAIAGCMAFVVLMSEKANASAFVRAETELAFGKRDIYPVRIADVQPASGLALFLRLKHWTDAFGPERDANLTRLAETINRMASDRDELTPPPPTPPAPPPPPGPQPLLIVPEPDPSLLPLTAEDATRAYIGDKAPHFLEKWRRMDAGKSLVSFSFPGFLFGPFWLFYRKIYREGLIVAAVAFVMSSFAVFGQVMNEAVIQVFVNLVSLALALSIGLFGNHLYRRHVARQTALLDKAGEPPQAVRDRLVMQGGTSPGSAIGLFAALFVVNLIMLGLARTCCAPPDPVPYVYPTTPATDSSLVPTSTPAPTPASESASPAATIWSVCIDNQSGYDMTFTINPDRSDLRQVTLSAGQSTRYTSDSAIDPTVRYDADATSGSNLVTRTATTSLVASADTCGKTFRFSTAGDTVSLDEAP